MKKKIVVELAPAEAESICLALEGQYHSEIVRELIRQLRSVL